jgi:hypothetical protein
MEIYARAAILSIHKAFFQMRMVGAMLSSQQSPRQARNASCSRPFIEGRRKRSRLRRHQSWYHDCRALPLLRVTRRRNAGQAAASSCTVLAEAEHVATRTTSYQSAEPESVESFTLHTPAADTPRRVSLLGGNSGRPERLDQAIPGWILLRRKCCQHGVSRIQQGYPAYTPCASRCA